MAPGLPSPPPPPFAVEIADSYVQVAMKNGKSLPGAAPVLSFQIQIGGKKAWKDVRLSWDVRL